MKSKIKLYRLALGTILLLGCCHGKKVMASTTEAYKRQSLNGRHVGAYVPPIQYHLPSGFTVPQGKIISTSNGSIQVQLNEVNSTLNIPSDKLIMYSDTKEKVKMDTNTSNLQYVVDAVSSAGGGVITIKAGNYYMTPGGYSDDNGRNNHYVIFAKDNVTIAGTLGSDGDLLTTFLPYGAEVNGITMFQYFQKDWNNIKYLDNADYRDFKIDGINATTTGNFFAQGKGFAFVIAKNCDWYNVEVQNTNGTGFGMDELVNSTVINCSANACGNYGLFDSTQTPPRVGASGFGIGYGYSANESINIKYCLATNNKRFGIFFECQGRFSRAELSNYTVVEKLEASNNICAGNTYNMGGEYCFNSRFINNVGRRFSTEYEYPNPMNVTNNNILYYFGKTNGTESRNNTVIFPNKVSLILPEYEEDERYTDSKCNDWNFTPIHFVTESNYMDAQASTLFGASSIVTRGEIVETLYRMYGSPHVNYSNLYTDVPYNHKYVNSIMWANNFNIAKGYQDGTGKFGPDDIIKRRDACIMFYRYARLKNPTITSNGGLSNYPDGDEITVQEHKAAVAWCLNVGIISLKKDAESGENKILPSDTLSREELAAMSFKFVNYMQDYYLKGDMNTDTFINSTDAAIVLDCYKNSNAIETDYYRGDMNVDDQLNATDASIILDMFKNSTYYNN